MNLHHTITARMTPALRAEINILNRAFEQLVALLDTDLTDAERAAVEEQLNEWGMDLYDLWHL